MPGAPSGGRETSPRFIDASPHYIDNHNFHAVTPVDEEGRIEGGSDKVIPPEKSTMRKTSLSAPATIDASSEGKTDSQQSNNLAPAQNGVSSHGGSGFSLMENEEEEKLLGNAGPLPADGLSASPHLGRLNGSGRAKEAASAPTLRSASCPKGPVPIHPDGGMTSPELGRAVSVTSLNGAPCSLVHPPLDKKSSKVVNEYYKKQNELIENFNADKEQIQVFQKTRTRQRLLSTNSQEPKEGETDPAAPLLQNTDGEEDVSVVPSTAADGKKKHSTTVAVDFGDDDGRENADLLEKAAEMQDADKKTRKAVSRLANVTLAVNIGLALAKAFAAFMSGSLSIFSSLADSLVDITSGLLIFLASRAIRKRDPYLYPRGRTRLEPISLIVISAIMAFASFQIIVESSKRIYHIASADEEDFEVKMNPWSAGIMVATIIIKATLVFVYRNYNDASIRVLAMDHRNDCISNSVALICAAFTPLPGGLTFFGTWGWDYFDPIGAIIVALYIIKTWFATGKEHVVMLAGKTANPEFINRIIKVCIDHDPRIEHIDTVYVYHYGMKFLVEVHIVLDENMPLKVAHDISESLQINIESLPDVERAFVHTDYEFEHLPQDEHKVV